MRSQWWWLNQLIIAFQQHVRNAEMYQQVRYPCYCFHVIMFSNLAMNLYNVHLVSLVLLALSERRTNCARG